MKILIVEDEKALSDGIVSYLKSEDYVCETAADSNKAIAKIAVYDYDYILPGITIPGCTWPDLLKELIANKKMDGVLIISACNSPDDKITGLTLRADDYSSKPFHLSELSVRVAAVIRSKSFDGNNLLKFENITIDTVAKSASVKNKVVELTKKGYEMLLYFVSNKNRVFSKDAIAEHLWADDMQGSNDFIYTQIEYLRRKLMETAKADYIKALYGMGYKFSAQ